MKHFFIFIIFLSLCGCRTIKNNERKDERVPVILDTNKFENFEITIFEF